MTTLNITSSRRKYKSYEAKEFVNKVGSTGTIPTHLDIKITTAKKPVCTVNVGVSWFSNLSGCGGLSARKHTITNPDLIVLARGLITQADDTGIVAFIDAVLESELPEQFKQELLSWYEYAQQENPVKYRDEKLRQQAFDRKVYEPGDLVIYTRHWPHDRLYRVISTHFDWACYLGGGWRYNVRGISAFAENFRKPTEEELAKNLPVTE